MLLVLAVAVAALLVSGGVSSRAAAATVYRAYVTNVGSGTVTPIEVATNKAGTPITVGSEPEGVAITPNGETAYVADYHSGTVTPINVATNTAGTPITVGSHPWGVAITPNGETAYITNFYSGTVTPIDVATNTAGTPITVGPYPLGVAITPNGETAYVTNEGSNSVTPIEVATNKAGPEIKVGEYPAAVAITPNGETAYVTNLGSNSVTPIEVATNKAGPEIKVGEYPAAVAITPNGETAYVTNEVSGTVTPIEVATNKAGTPITVGSEPDGVAITPNSETAYVISGGKVTPIEVATNKAGTPITVGSGPSAVAITDAPEAEIKSPAGGGVYAKGQVVSTKFSCTEGEDGPGIASCDDNDGTSGVSGIIEGKLNTSTLGEYEYTVTAKSTDGEFGTATIKYTVAAPPTAEIKSPAGGGVYAVGETVKTTFSCADSTYGSGIKACDDNNGTSGVSGTIMGKLNTTTTGLHSYTVTAEGNDGQSGTATIIYTVAKATCTANSGKITLSPGLTNTAARQTLKIKGALTGCTGESFTGATYTATLKTSEMIGCPVLKTAGELASGAAKFKWTPKTKPGTSTGTLEMLLTETPSVAFSGALTAGPFSPLALSGKTSMTFTGGSTCGVPVGKKPAKAVKKGTFTGTTVAFE